MNYKPFLVVLILHIGTVLSTCCHHCHHHHGRGFWGFFGWFGHGKDHGHDHGTKPSSKSEEKTADKAHPPHDHSHDKKLAEKTPPSVNKNPEVKDASGATPSHDHSHDKKPEEKDSSAAIPPSKGKPLTPNTQDKNKVPEEPEKPIGSLDDTKPLDNPNKKKSTKDRTLESLNDDLLKRNNPKETPAEKTPDIAKNPNTAPDTKNEPKEIPGAKRPGVSDKINAEPKNNPTKNEPPVPGKKSKDPHDHAHEATDKKPQDANNDPSKRNRNRRGFFGFFGYHGYGAPPGRGFGGYGGRDGYPGGMYGGRRNNPPPYSRDRNNLPGLNERSTFGNSYRNLPNPNQPRGGYYSGYGGSCMGHNNYCSRCGRRIW